MKCDTCQNQKSELDVYGNFPFCAKGHWEGGPIENPKIKFPWFYLTGKKDPWGDCKDYNKIQPAN